MAVLTLVNLASARSYGEFEFWFASIKVAAIIVFIVVAAAWLLGVGNPASPGFSNLTAHGGFAPFGYGAVFAGMTTVIFSMCGAEIITVAAAESAESGKTMSRLAASVVVRILLFYVVAILLILCIAAVDRDSSPAIPPFAMALERIGIPGARTIMNLIVLTAVLSCLNSGVYVTARMLFAMADKGDAPTLAHGGEQAAGAGARHPAGQRLRFHRDVAQQDRAGQRIHIRNCSRSSSMRRGAIMLIVYFFVAVAHFRFPYSAYAARNSGSPRVTNFIAGGAALAILVVMVAMAHDRPARTTELYASLGCLAVIARVAVRQACCCASRLTRVEEVDSPLRAPAIGLSGCSRESFRT